MKIIQLCKKIPYPPLDGESVAIWDITMQLLNNGFVVYLICMQTTKHKLNPENKLFQHKNLNWQIIDVNTKINIFGVFFTDFFSKKTYIANRYFNQNFLSKLKSIVQTFQPDILQAESIYTAEYLKHFKQSKFIKVIRSHNVENEIWKIRAKNEPNFLKKIYFIFLAQKIRNYELNTIKNCDLLVNISESDTLFFKRNAPSIEMLSVATGYPISKNKTSETRPIYLFLGALDWFPNIEALNWFIQKVWPKVLQELPEAQLFIAGRNPSDKNIEHWSKTKNVRFYGEIKSAKKFLERGRVVIVPLKTGSGIRIKIIEAMALGIPVVATEIAAKGINISNKKNILIAKTEDKFAQNMLDLYSDKILYEKIKVNAQSFINLHYNSSILIEKLLEKYKQIISIKNAQ